MTSDRTTSWRAPSRWWPLRAILVGALVAAAYVVVPAAAPGLLTRARADGDQPVSGAFNLGGGLAGAVDERTGQFSVSLPLVKVASRGDSDVSFSLSWVQSRAGNGVDRLGWGEGWSLGSAFIDTSGGVTVYPASGGAYQQDTDGQFASGLENYTLHDLQFCTASADPAAGCDPTGTPPTGCITTSQLCARPPAVPDAVPYSYTINYDDGKTDFFDANGNLVARTDRYGSRTDLQYRQVGQTPDGDLEWQPTAIVDAYGQVTTFSYGPSSMTVTSPKRSDGTTPATVVTFNDDGGLHSVTDPVGQVTSFGYQGEGNYQYVDQVTNPTGAQTQVGYTENDYSDADTSLAVFTAQTLDVLDPTGAKLSPTRTFDIDPATNQNQQNYAGNNGYLSSTEDALFASGDSSYVYQTEISTDALSTLSTYDSAHRLIERQVLSDPGNSTPVVVQDQVVTYPPLVSIADGQVPPANYSKPTGTTVTSRAVSGPTGITQGATGRTVTSASTFDSHGRKTSSTDETGVTTTTTYDPEYGLVTGAVTTSAANKTLRTITTTLTDDHKNIQTATQADLGGDGKLSARSTLTYTYDEYGRPTSRTVGWAKDAAPPDNGGGPASTTTTYTSTEDVAAATRTVAVTTADGTNAASTTTTVLDLVSGEPVSFTDGAGRVTTTQYDAANRTVQVSPPTGLVTKTSYGAANLNKGTPATMTVTGPDGHVTKTTYDALGRTVSMTDNVKNGAFVSDDTTRTVSTVSYSPDGTTITSTDRTGRTTKTVDDTLGRPVVKVGPTGVTTTTSYDDVDNKTTESTFAVGASRASQITSTAYDALNRVVASRTTYPTSARTSLVDPATLKSYDGLSRTTSFTGNDLTAVPDNAGAGGVPVTTSLAPARTARVQSPAVTITDTTALDASPTLRTLQYAGDTQVRPSTQLSYDAAGDVTTTTDPLGRTTTYTYAADGRPATRTGADGSVRTNTYDPATGQLSKVSARASDGTTTSTTYSYVPSGQVGAGLVKSMTNESGTITYGYDADRNRTSVSYPDGSTASSDYLDNGLLHTSTDVTGAVTTFTYYPDASMQSAVQVRGGVTLASVSYTYDGLQRIKTTTRGNKLVTTNTYTPNNLLASEITVDGSGNQVEAHSYAYDNHHLLTRKTDTTAKPSRCTVICTAGPGTYGTYTTTYGYDAYDRLTGSAVYSGSSATGTPTTKLSYVLDVTGNITTTTRTTNQTVGGRPSQAVQVTSDTINSASQLTQRSVGSKTASQSYDKEGRVLVSLSGSSTTYRPDGLPATVTAGGATTTFSYWPDGTRRRAVTVDPVNGNTTVDFHYGVDRTLVNDTTTHSGAGNAGAATASYLLTVGREARTLQPVTAAAGRLRASGAPVTTGAGVGYLLRDRHSSVTALVDSSGAVTNTYAYSDYGAPTLLDGRPGTITGAAAGTTPGTTNPLQYSGAGAKSLYTDVSLGTMMTPARFYDPSQARYTARDVADVHNLYVGFAANPITMSDPTGQTPLVDTILDFFYALTFVIAAVVTAGAAVAAYGAVIAATEATAALVVPVIAQAAATAVNAAGAAVSATRFADGVEKQQGGKGFLSDDQRTDLGDISTALGSVAGAAGGIASFSEHFVAKAATSVATVVGDAGNAAGAAGSGAPQIVEGVPSEIRPPGQGGEPVPDPQVQGRPTNVVQDQPNQNPAESNAGVNGAPRPNVQAPAEGPPAPLEDPPPPRVAQLPSSAEVLQNVKGKVNAAQTVATIGDAIEEKIVDQQDPTLPKVLSEKSSANAGPGEVPPANNWVNYDGPPPQSGPDGPGSFLQRTDTGWSVRGRVWH